MRFPLACTAGLALATLGILAPGRSQGQPNPANQHVAAAGPRTPPDEQKGFHLPPGFEIQLVASEPAIHKPINIAFDDRGRLWVTETVEYPFPATAGARPRDSVKVLDDFQDDGRARTITTFADGLNIPIGVLPLSRGAMVYTIPTIDRLLDTAGTGRADRREVLYGTFGYVDTHGMASNFTRGFDGWVYACHGFRNTSVVKGSDGAAITLNSGNTFRMRPDGSHLEYFTHGLVNPFGLTLDPLGNLYASDCETKPITMLLRGAYYPSFGKPDDGLGFAPEMMSHTHGSTAIAGIVYYAADHFPAAYRDTIFVGNVVTNRINHDRLERHGSTFRAVEQADFLRSDDPWFRPVNIKLGPDGALYVADFYNRIIGHYEVPLTHPGRDHRRGRIWRIIYRGLDGKGKPAAPRADWTRATVAELVHNLGHPNLVVRMTAAHQLVSRGGPRAVDAVRAVMQPGSSPWQRIHGLWVLEQRGALDDRTLEAAARDRASGVRVHAMRVLAERRTLAPPLRALAVAGLADRDGFVQRAAAEALGRHPAPANIRPLLDLRHTVPAADTHLLHVVRMALRDQLRPASAWAHLPVAPWTDQDARAVADVATGVPTAEAARFLLQHIQRLPEGSHNLVRYVHHIARYGTGAADQALLAFARADHPADLGRQVALVKAIQQGAQERGAPVSGAVRSWATELTRKLIGSPATTDVLAGIELAGALKLEAVEDTLVALAANRRSPAPQRGAALKALATLGPARHLAILGRVLGDTSEPLALREQAVTALVQINRPEARAPLLTSLPAAPGRLQDAIAAGLASSRAGAEPLLDAVAAGKGSARLLQEPAVELRLAAAGIPDLPARLARLTRGLPPADRRVQELLSRRRAGFAAAKADPRRGAQVFAKHCMICHQLSGKGARIGPRLDGIGIRGVDRLTEDILDPNRNVDPGFRVTTLGLASGEVVSGLVVKEEGEVLVLANSQGQEVRIPRRTVEEQAVSQLSPMPANFADQIAEADFYDLLAYLLTQTTPPGGPGKDLAGR